MNIEATPGRIRVSMTRVEALKQIAKLSEAIAHADKTGSAWWGDGCVYEGGERSFAGRVTFEVEG